MNGEAIEGVEVDIDGAEPGSSLRWWREVLIAGVFYLVYSIVRNTQGSASVSDEKAYAEALGNALKVIRLEEVLGIYREEALQQLFLGWRAFIEFWNLFYGTFHFVVTIFALVLLYRKFPLRYRKWRNTLAVTTGLALIGFATYPLMPPRLLPASHGYVDTLKVFGSPWSFDSGAMNKISNQYAAMPSLHFAWAMWSACALVPALRRGWSKALAAAYPVATLFAVVVTANHFVLDAVAGVVVLVVGGVIGFALAARFGPSGPEPEPEPHADQIGTPAVAGEAGPP